jgi:glyoxylase-like metal-dependent hydrolase (beta-lactamase superfamily II)
VRLTRCITIIAALVLAGCASRLPERALVEDAASAIGGADRIQSANTLVIEGSGETGNFGQNIAPDSALPISTITEHKRTIDYANNRSRLEQTVKPTFITANTAAQKQIQSIDGNVAFNVAADGAATRANDLVATDRRIFLYHHPVGALRAALREGAQVTNFRSEGGNEAVDVATGGDKFTLYIDPATKLPSKVVSIAHNVTIGDTPIETTFANYTDSDGIKMPGRLTTRTDGKTSLDIQVSKTTVNGSVSDLAAPANVASAAAIPAAAPALVEVEEVGKGVWYLRGQSHHSVLVEFADHLALVESPQHDLRAAGVLAKVKELRPDKPLRYVINTHHHFDHSGGVRTAMAAGATIITHAANKGFYENLATRKFTIMPDTLSKNPQAAKIETVSDKRVLTDGTKTIEIYAVPNPHADTMLMVYFPAERLLAEVDLYTPPNPGQPPAVAYPFAPSVVQTAQKLGLRVDRLMPLHGPGLTPYSSILAVSKGS